MGRAASLHGLLISALCAGAASAQTVPDTAPPQPAEAVQSAPLPPPDSPPLVRVIELRFPAQGNRSVIDPQTYLYYMHTQPSRPSQDAWVPYDEQDVRDDFQRLWATGFLDDLTIDVQDVPYANGVMGKHIIFVMEERQRVRTVDYRGSKTLERSKIDGRLQEADVVIRVDSFIDPALIGRAKAVLQEMLADKGYQFGGVRSEITPLPGGPKLVRVTFHIDDGPKVRIRDIDFVGNTAIGDGALKRQMKANREPGVFAFITGGGTYLETKFEEDADKVVEYYRNRGYVTARVGQPELQYLEETGSKTIKWVRLRVPVQEGRRYRLGDFTLAGNSIGTTEALEKLFTVTPGDWYSESAIRKGIDKARDLYGSGGYFEFTAFPDLRPREASGEALVDVTMRIQEGPQYFVNRIALVGNSTTRDKVVRREMRLVENGVFNTEALKLSIRRINQLGYFKPLEGQDAVKVQKTPGRENHVDVTLAVEEQNRNQITFGAGASQFEGFFGQLSFQTANFLGRGESLTLSLQSGSRAQQYQLGFTEPYLFDRPITAGFNVFKRETRFITQFTRDAVGGDVVVGFPVADFTRMFLNYSYERARVDDLNPSFLDPVVLSRNPFLRDSLLIGQDGERTISKITPSLVHNTVDNPIFPTSGRRYTLALELAGVGGDTRFSRPRAEGVWYVPHTRRTSLGLRGELEYIAPFGSTRELPIFEKLFLGGENSVRGLDIRTIGPRDPVTGLVLGGNKSLLVNAEYLVTIAGPVRLVLFYDAAQVQGEGRQFRVKDFRTSTGAEMRFFMPVLNVPFRLIFAANPQRAGVLDDTLRPAKAFSVRFAVGSTF
ncbi:MAG: outer membrane protein assembly factor BamA [Acidobacteria bacterium]|nr:outer membrane protein assembly factor BamA [Acidobacteriota bacterium]